MRRIESVSSAELIGFIEDVVEPGATIVTDYWNAYTALNKAPFFHERHNISGAGIQAHEVLPAVHRVTSLLKRWLLGTHQGSVSPQQLDYYLAEYCFRFNRRRSGSRGLLFYNLILQAAQTEPKPYLELITPAKAAARRTKVAAAKAKRDRGIVGDPLNVSHLSPKRPGSPRTTLIGSPTNKRRFVVGGRRGI